MMMLKHSPVGKYLHSLARHNFVQCAKVGIFPQGFVSLVSLVFIAWILITVLHTRYSI